MLCISGHETESGRTCTQLPENHELHRIQSEKQRICKRLWIKMREEQSELMPEYEIGIFVGRCVERLAK